MPIMDGAAMTEAVQAMNPDVKILSSSGLAPNVEMTKPAAPSGALSFISKPYTTERLLQTIDELLKR
jgi:FixJ family two-component response regulator